MKTRDKRFENLLKRPLKTIELSELKSIGISNKIKTFVKQWPGLYNFLRETVGPTHSPWSGYNLRKRVDVVFAGDYKNKVVVNVGSGTNRFHPEVVNLDIFSFKNVDIVADISDTPFKDSTVDGVVCDSVFEHIADIPGALKEISRIVKPGGTFLLTSLFLYPYHSSPQDFFRWTEEGMRHILKQNNFEVIESGVHGGPMGALQGVLMHVFATLFSCGSKTAYFLLTQFFMVLFSPLKLLDPLLSLSPFAKEAASDIFIVAKKI